MSLIKQSLTGMCLVCCLGFAGCKSGYKVVNIEGTRFPMTKVYDAHPNKKSIELIAAYKHRIDSMMSPVLGRATMDLKSYRPESPLSNLISDVLRTAGVEKTGKPVAVAVMNMGGIRSSITKGEVSFGDVFEVAPFENRLCVLKMKGNVLRELFGQIAGVRGEGISGARLLISKDGKLLEATVDGKALVDDADYWVATNDYLAEGNDKMTAFLKGSERIYPEQASIRQLLVDYINGLTRAGKTLQMQTDGRITVK